MNTRQKEFFVERFLHSVLDVAVPWFIMVITYTPKKGLETSKSEDTSVQIVTAHLKKTVVSGRALSLFFLIRLMISSNYSDLTMFHMKEFLPLWILYIPVSYTHLRAHETGRNLVCRLLLEKKKKKIYIK